MDDTSAWANCRMWEEFAGDRYAHDANVRAPRLTMVSREAKSSERSAATPFECDTYEGFLEDYYLNR